MKATCECGNIEIDWDTSFLELVARKCGCSYCKLQNAEYVSDSKSTLAFRVLDSSMLNVVRHGTGTSLFHECKNCGLVIVTSEIEGHTYGVLNIKVLGLKGYSVDPIIKDFIAETAKERLARRKRNWCKVRQS